MSSRWTMSIGDRRKETVAHSPLNLTQLKLQLPDMTEQVLVHLLVRSSRLTELCAELNNLCTDLTGQRGLMGNDTTLHVSHVTLEGGHIKSTGGRRGSKLAALGYLSVGIGNVNALTTLVSMGEALDEGPCRTQAILAHYCDQLWLSNGMEFFCFLGAGILSMTKSCEQHEELPSGYPLFLVTGSISTP